MSQYLRQRMKNYMIIRMKGADVTTARNIEFYVKQGETFFQLAPEVVSESELVVEIPFEKAMALEVGDCQVQIAYVDENGTPFATEPETITVGELLKEAGYAGV